MGDSLELYRCRIGGFMQPSKLRVSVRMLNLHKIPMCIRLVLFLLLVVNGVERNPGPATGRGAPAGRGSNFEGGQKASASVANRRTSRNSVDRRTSDSGRGNAWRGTGRNQSTRGRGESRESYESTRVQHSSPPTSRLRSSQRISNQRNISDWLDNMQTEEGSPIDTESVHSRESLRASPNNTHDIDLDSADIKKVILDTNKTVKSLSVKFDKVQKDIGDLKKSNETLKRENRELHEQVANLTEHVLNLEEKVEETERRNEHIEAQSRRDNLLFFGFRQQGNESWDDSESKVREYLKDQLKIDESKISIERAHRLKRGNGSHPIIVKFSHYKEREKVLKSYREIKKGERAARHTGDDDDDDAVESS